MLVGGENMAEFCLDCWNKMENTDFTEKEASLTRRLYLCEGCGEYKRVLTSMPYRESRFKHHNEEPPIKIFIRELKKQFGKK